jgi:hypothetical protein
MDVGKLLKQTQDQSLYTNWQGGIFALEKIKLMIVSNIDAEIFKLKNLSNSTDIGKTMNRIEEKTNGDKFVERNKQRDEKGE